MKIITNFWKAIPAVLKFLVAITAAYGTYLLVIFLTALICQVVRPSVAQMEQWPVEYDSFFFPGARDSLAWKKNFIPVTTWYGNWKVMRVAKSEAWFTTTYKVFEPDYSAGVYKEVTGKEKERWLELLRPYWKES